MGRNRSLDADRRPARAWVAGTIGLIVVGVIVFGAIRIRRGIGSTAPSDPVHRGRTIREITYHGQGLATVRLDLYLPEGAPPPGGWPVILAFPGGGWRHADRKDYGRSASTFTSYGYAVAAVDYTYAEPGGGPSWPANLEDARAAVGWARAHAVEYGLNPDKVVAMGESAGAHLALLLATDPSIGLRAVVDVYGATDLAALYAESRAEVLPYFHTFLGGPPSQFPDRYADASPLRHVSASTAPILIYQGLADRTVLPSQALALDAALTKAGVRHKLVVFEGITHGFRFAIGPYNFVPEIAAFLDEALDGGPIDRPPG